MTTEQRQDLVDQATVTAPASPVIYIVDDDEDVGESLSVLLASHHLEVAYFSYPEQFLTKVTLDRPGCIILDLKMPELDGLAVLNRLAERGIYLPVIFLSGYGTIAKAVEAVRKGALDFLEKPCPGQVLIERVNDALKVDSQRRELERQAGNSRQRIERLTRREREVFGLVAKGKSNRDIATLLAISPRTVETHRKRIMKKMAIRGFDELLSVAKNLRLN